MSLLDLNPAPAAAPAASLIDTSKVSANLDQIHAIEAGWTLPKLPDMVKLDLAQFGPDKPALSSFLYGLASDINSPTAAPDSGLVVPDTTAPATDGRSFSQELANEWAGWNNLRPPQTVNEDAVTQFKSDAVAKGLLPPDTPIDSRWDPAFSTVQHQMLSDQAQSRLGGNRPGAISWQGVSKMFADWGSPTGLLKAAVTLQLLPNFGHISTWGDKWAKIGESKNPLDFGKNLLGALAGPVDDVIVPVLNDLLLFTGIGEATAFGRLAFAARKGVDLGEAVDGIYQTGRFAKAAGELEAFTKPGWLAQRAPGVVGDAMSAWRNLPEVATAKKLVQTTMKLGLASRLESTMPGYTGGGFNVGQLPGVQKSVDDIASNPLAWIPEMAFTPTTIFGHGTVTKWAKQAGSGLLTAAEHTVSPVLGAVGGALEATPDFMQRFHLQSLGRTMSNLSFQRMTEEGQPALAAFHDAVVTHLEQFDPARAAQYQQIVRDKNSVTQGLLWHTGLPDTLEGRAALAQNMSFGTLMAGIDVEPSAILKAQGIDRYSEQGQAIYNGMRDKKIAQIRKFDEADKTGILANAAMGRGGSKEAIGRVFNQMMNDPALTDDVIAEMARTHNAAAEEHLTMAWTHATPEALQKYLPQVMPTFGNWLNFSEMSQTLHEAQMAGLFDNAQYLLPKSEAGRSLSISPELKGVAGREASATSIPGQSELTGTFEGGPPKIWQPTKLPTDAPVLTTGSYRPLANPIEPWYGRFTGMREDTLAKGEVITAGNRVASAISADTAFRRLNSTAERTAILSGIDRKLAETGLNLGTADPETVANMIREATSLNSTAIGGKSLDTIRSYMRRNNVTFDQVGSHLANKLNELEFSPDWGPRFGFESTVRDAKDNILNGVDALKMRLKQLNTKAKYTAAEIDVPHLIADATERYGADSDQVAKLTALRDKFAGTGFKLVHGVEYAAPVDLLDRGMPFSARGGIDGLYPDVTQRHLNAVRLGNFVQAHEDSPWYRALIVRQRSTAIAEQLDQLRAKNAAAGIEDHPGLAQLNWHDTNDIIDPNAPDLRRIVDDLHRKILDPAQQAANDSRMQMGASPLVARTSSRISNVFTPQSLSDLGLSWNQKKVVQSLAPLYGEDGAAAIWRGILKSKVQPFSSVGLAQLEQRLRAYPIVTEALKTLSGVDHPALSRTVGGAVGAVAGANLAGDNGQSPLVGGAVGGLAGAALTPSLLKGAAKVADVLPVVGKLGPTHLADVFENSAKWNRYAYMGNTVMGARDAMRFSLSPMFDLYRYAHGTVFGVLADEGLKVNQTPSALRRTFAKEFIAGGGEVASARAFAADKWNTAVAQFRAAARGEHDFESIDDAQRFFSQVGILGFDQTQQMASTFHQLQAAGMSPAEAYEKTRAISDYGVHGRSALNKSINTLFFPFSFQAKQMKAIGSFVGKDWGRAVAMHDAYKTYELLNDQYDLNTFWKNHIPALQQLEKVNMFAHGISPGSFGGINAPLIKAAAGLVAPVAAFASDPIMNFFAPQGVHLGGDLNWSKLSKTMTKLLPAYNDINTMVQGLKDQGHVVFGASHEIASQEATDGFKEWNDYRHSVNDALKAKGFKWGDIAQKPELGGLNDVVTKKRLELESLYPGWKAARERSVSNAEALNLEIKAREAMFRAGTPLDPSADGAFMDFKTTMDNLDKFMASQHLSQRDDMDKLPLEVLDGLRQAAVSYASQPGDAGKGFLQMYKKYWLKRLGPISRDV
jgi:hypothetical protein